MNNYTNEPLDFNELYINLKDKKFLINGQSLKGVSRLCIVVEYGKVHISMDKHMKSKVYQLDEEKDAS